MVLAFCSRRRLRSSLPVLPSLLLAVATASSSDGNTGRDDRSRRREQKARTMGESTTEDPQIGESSEAGTAQGEHNQPPTWRRVGRRSHGCSLWAQRLGWELR